ncbi:MAG: MFS transporter [Kiritimatiellae bacterium]|nr:MFS transporter [Kiritimatiellia bacterium]
MAGCGGLLFDFGGTVINPAIPYLESLGLFTTAQLSHLTSAVVLGAAVSGLAAGAVAEWIGRKKAMLLASAVAGLAALPICLGGGSYWSFYAGGLMQGVAAGLVGVVVPMYLAETLDAANRGKGAGVFQFMDVVGILFCSLVGVAVVRIFGGPGDPATAEGAKIAAWKAVFWTSAVPAAVFFAGAHRLRRRRSARPPDPRRLRLARIRPHCRDRAGIGVRSAAPAPGRAQSRRDLDIRHRASPARRDCARRAARRPGPRRLGHQRRRRRNARSARRAHSGFNRRPRRARRTRASARGVSASAFGDATWRCPAKAGRTPRRCSARRQAPSPKPRGARESRSRSCADRSRRTPATSAAPGSKALRRQALHPRRQSARPSCSPTPPSASPAAFSILSDLQPSNLQTFKLYGNNSQSRLFGR